MSNFKDFPCLYYISEYGNEKELNKQMALLMYMHGLSFDEMVDKSKFLNLTSDGRIKNFLNSKIASSMVKEYQGNDTGKMPSCGKIQKLKHAKTLNLAMNCCYVCPLSPTYINAELDKERAIYKYIFEHYSKDTTWLACKPEMFTSVVSVGRCNDLLRYPYIPFYRMLLGRIHECFKVDSSKLSIATLCEKLFKPVKDYICKNHKAAVVDDALIKSFIFKEISIINETPLITKSDYIAAKQQLVHREAYEPPVFTRAVPLQDIPADIVIGGNKSDLNQGKKDEVHDKKDNDSRPPKAERQKVKSIAELCQEDGMDVGTNDELWNDDSFYADPSSENDKVPGEVVSEGAEVCDTESDAVLSEDTCNAAPPTPENIVAESEGEQVVPVLETVPTTIAAETDDVDSATSESRDGDGKDKTPLDDIESIDGEVEGAERSNETAEGGTAVSADTENEMAEGSSEDSDEASELLLDVEPSAEKIDDTVDAAVHNTLLDEEEEEGKEEVLLSSSDQDVCDIEAEQPAAAEDGIDIGTIEQGLESELQREMDDYDEDEGTPIDVYEGYFMKQHDYEPPCREIYKDIPYISDRFEGFIIRLDRGSSYVDFIQDIAESAMLPIEYVHIGIEYGFLIFAYRRFYFMSADRVSDKLFSVMCGDAKGTRFISLNPVWVYAGMRRLGVSYRPIISLATIYKATYELDALPSVSRIFDLIIEDAPKKKEEIRKIDKDTLWLIMPRYDEVFRDIWSDKMILVNKQASKYEWAISKSTDLSLFLAGPKRNYVSGGNSLTADILFTRTTLLNSVRAEGVFIGVNAKIGVQTLKDNEIWRIIAGNVSMMDSKKSYAYLVGISDEGLSYYVCDYFELFYDYLLSAIRRVKTEYEEKLIKKYKLDERLKKIENELEGKSEEEKKKAIEEAEEQIKKALALNVNIQMIRFSFKEPVVKKEADEEKEGSEQPESEKDQKDKETDKGDGSGKGDNKNNGKGK